jgi:ADP-ribose pyrophosphatase YjhB (NUDIX family)
MATDTTPTHFYSFCDININFMTQINVRMLCFLAVFETPGNSSGLATYERMEHVSHLYTTVRDLGDQTMTSTDVGFHSVFDYTKKPFVITASKVNIFEQPLETLYSLGQKASFQSKHSRTSGPDSTSHYATKIQGL